MTPPKTNEKRSPKRHATTTPGKTTSTSAPEVATATAATTKTPTKNHLRSQKLIDDGNANLARVRSAQLLIDTAKSWRPSKKFSNGTGAEYRSTMCEFERVEALEGLSSRILLQELRHYFGGSAGGIVESHLKCEDSEEALREVKIILDDLFGQKIDSTTSMMDVILSSGQIGRDDYQAHIALYKELVELDITAKSSKAVDKIDTRENVHKIVKNCLAYGSEDFHRKEVKLIREHGRHSTMKDLKEKISERLKIIDNKKAGEMTRGWRSEKSDGDVIRRSPTTTTTASTTPSTSSTTNNEIICLYNEIAPDSTRSKKSIREREEEMSDLFSGSRPLRMQLHERPVGGREGGRS